MKSKESSILPNFCSIHEFGMLVFLAQILSVLLSILSHDFWSSLALTSFFVQWVTISCAVILCLLAPKLRRLKVIKTLGISYAIILSVVLLYSEVSFYSYASQGDHLWFSLRNLFVAAILAALYLRYLFLQYQWKHQLEAETAAQLEIMQARIRPHFLFNSMNTISSLIRQQPELAEELMQELAKLFRQSLKESQKRVSLKQELELVKGYLHIEQMRLQSRLTVDWQLDELPDDALIPPLSIQPLVENAIYHGIEPLEKGGVVSLRGEQQDEQIQIRIENQTGCGDSLRQGNHIAQQNIATRLAAWHGPAAGLEVQQDAQQYCVTLRIPYEH